MAVANVITIIVVMSGIIFSLIGIIYKILSDRINIVSKAYNEFAVSIASIETNIRWIKKKLGV